ncbi:MAG: transporter [Gemmatimonadota bacterium]|nr:transporter [Gemmatimonadota bacterium]
MAAFATLALGSAPLAVTATPAFAQELVPAAYTPAPMGVQLITATATLNDGELSFEPTAPIEDARASIFVTSVAYARTFGLFGRSANVTIGLPFLSGHVEGLYLGEFAEADRDGLADAAARLGVNLIGAPSMTPVEFRDFRPGTMLGASLSLRAPTGQYDSQRLLNIGTNRWALKPELGLVQVIGDWAIDAYIGTWFYTTNGDFLGEERSRKPVIVTELHLRRAFGSRVWASLDGNFWGGGRTTVGDVTNDDRQRESRLGATFAWKAGRSHTFRLAGSIGAVNRIGGDFTSIGIAYAYTWRGGG